MKVTFETTTKVLEKIHISSSKVQEEIEQLRKEVENSLVDREYAIILVGLLKIKVENLIKEMKFLASYFTEDKENVKIFELTVKAIQCHIDILEKEKIRLKENFYRLKKLLDDEEKCE